MGLLLSCSHLQGEDSTPQSVFYTGWLLKSNFPLIIIGATDLNEQKPLFPSNLLYFFFALPQYMTFDRPPWNN